MTPPRLLVALGAAGVGCAAAGYVGVLWTAPTPAWASWCLLAGSQTATGALMALGAARRGRLPRRVVVAIVAAFAGVALVLALALLLPPREGAGAPLLLGLPVRTALVFYGIGLLPFGLSFVHAATFDDSGLDDAALDRLRALVPPSGPGA